MENIYVTKNNCKTVLAYSKERFEKFEKLMPKIGYRKLTDKEVDAYLKKQGYEEVKPMDAYPKKMKVEKEFKPKPKPEVIEPEKINIESDENIIEPTQE